MPPSPLSTQCPHCQQVLEVTLHQLAQARGRAVCGGCQASFDALARLALHAPPIAESRQAYPVSNELPQLTPGRMRPASLAGAHTAPPQAASSTAAAPPTTRPSAMASPSLLRQAAVSDTPPVRVFIPEFVRHHARGHRTRYWLGLALGLILILGLSAWGCRQWIAHLPVTGPGIAWLCSVSGCQLPPMRDQQRLQLLARDVRADPSHPGQLAINIRLRNSAWFPQPYPAVTVQLQAPTGQALARQHFLPAQYLGHPLQPKDHIGAGEELTISLQMADPGTTASGFTLQLQ